MFLIDNLRIHCLEWDYPVDSSSLPLADQALSPMNKFCIRVCTLENTLSGL